MRPAKFASDITLAPLLAVLGVTHPRTLIPETASYWHALHLVLLALFPLLGVNFWYLLSGSSGWLEQTT